MRLSIRTISITSRDISPIQSRPRTSHETSQPMFMLLDCRNEVFDSISPSARDGRSVGIRCAQFSRSITSCGGRKRYWTPRVTQNLYSDLTVLCRPPPANGADYPRAIRAILPRGTGDFYFFAFKRKSSFHRRAYVC